MTHGFAYAIGLRCLVKHALYEHVFALDSPTPPGADVDRALPELSLGVEDVVAGPRHVLPDLPAEEDGVQAPRFGIPI